MSETQMQTYTEASAEASAEAPAHEDAAATTHEATAAAQDVSAEAPTHEAAPATKTVEAWCKELKTPAWLFAGARLGHRWPIGKELTKAQYVEALEKSANVVCR